MIKKITICVFIFIIFNLFAKTGNDLYIPADQGVNNIRKNTIVVLPERILREYDPITIFYPKPRGPKNGGYEDHPEKYIKTGFKQPGEFRWIDDMTLQFKPAVPWYPLKKIIWKIDNIEKVFFTVVNPPEIEYLTINDANYNTKINYQSKKNTNIIPNENKTTQTEETIIDNNYDENTEIDNYDENTETNNYDENIENNNYDENTETNNYDQENYTESVKPVTDNTKKINFTSTKELYELKQFKLSFSQKIEINDIYSILSVEIRNLPGIDSKKAVWLTKSDYTIKREEQSSISDNFKYIIILNKPIGISKKIFIHLKLSLDESLSDSKITYIASTKDNFQLYGFGSGNYVYPAAINGSIYTQEQAINGEDSKSIFLLFSDKVKEVNYTEMRKMIQFSPSVDNVAFTQSNERFYVNGNFKTDTTYEVTLNPVILKDINNRVLSMKNKSKFYVYFPQKSSFIKWGKNEGIVELYGPKQFPMQGRGIKKIDLRIYKIDPLSRKLWPFPQYPVLIDESKRSPLPGYEPPENNISYEYIYENELKDHLSMLSSPPFSRVIQLPISDKTGSYNFGLDLEPYLTEIWGENQTGSYIIGYRNLDGSKNRTYVRMQITDLCVTTVDEPEGMRFFVSSYKTALPQSGVEVRIEGYGNQTKSNYQWVTLSSGITDSSGMFYLKKMQNNNVFKRLVLKKDKDILVINPNMQLSSYTNNYWNNNTDNWFSNIFTDPQKISAKSRGFLFTERPVYKPEESVFIKGYARKLLQGKLSFPLTRKFKITVYGPGNKKWEYPVELSENGSCNLEFKEKDLPTGIYRATLFSEENGYSVEYSSISFSKQSYKIPLFEVNLHGDKKVPMDKPFKVSLTADYYAGGRVIGQPVLWRVTEFPYAYMPKSKKDFIFSSDSRYNSRSSKFTTKGTVTKEDIIDKTGFSSLTIDPTLAMDNMPRRYIFEATVTGSDEQTVTSTYDVFAVPSFVLGLKTERFIKNGFTIKSSIIACDENEKNIDGLPVTVRLKKREWHSHLKESSLSNEKPQYDTEQVDTIIEERKIKTELNEKDLTFNVKSSGIYLVELEARDSIGRMQTILTDIYVGGEGTMTWSTTENRIFKTTLNKPEGYNPGEKAIILLQSPFQQAKVLVIVEKPDKKEYSWIDVDDGKTVFELTIEDYFTPKIPVTFILMSPRIYDDGKIIKNELEDVGKPQTYAATQWIPVNPIKNILKVDLKHPDESSPGKKIEMEINLSDFNGKPINGEVTLWLVDQAVLSLGQEQNLNPVPNFIDEVLTRILVRDFRNQIIGKLKLVENPGGGGDEDEMSKEEMSANMKRSLLESATVRKNFKTVAFYSPSIIIDDSGKKKITIELPDNLTVFQIRAVACSKAEKFGFAKSEINIRLPLIIQSALPRFVRYGDELNAGGLGRIVVGDGGKGNASIEVNGATISGNKIIDINWETGLAKKIFFPMKVNRFEYNENGEAKDTELTVKMAVSRLKDGVTDAFEVKIPIKNDISKITTGFTKEVKKNIPLDFPDFQYKPRENSIKAQILLTNEITILKAIAGMDYLLEYPHGCLEQKISKAYAALLLKDLYNKYQIEEISPKMDTIFADTMEAIEQCRRSDGLYGFWPGSTGYVYLTAYVLEYLTTAKKAGYQVKNELIDSAVKVLKRALRSDYSQFVGGFEYEERVEALYALGDSGYFDSSYANTFAGMAQNYGVEGRSRILLTLQKNSYFDKNVINSLKKSLYDSAVFALRDGKEIFTGMQDKNKTWGGLINIYETKSLADAVSALSYNANYEGRLKLLVENLVSLGDKDGWGNTYVNAHVLYALKEYLSNQKITREKVKLMIKSGKTEKSLELNGTKTVALWKGSFVDKGIMSLVSSGSDKASFVNINVSYMPDVAGDEIKSASNGFVVDKEIIIVGLKNNPDTKIQIKNPKEKIQLKLGDIIEEHIQVVNPTDRNFVVIECPLAAGLEPMNPNLKTSPPEARTKGLNSINASYVKFLDDKVCYYFDTLPKGTYNFYFRTRAMTEGSFVEPQTYAQMMYEQAINGNCPGLRFIIKQ